MIRASVLPLTFYFVLLITVYTMVILGGQGNLAGVTVGAVVVSVGALGVTIEVSPYDLTRGRIVFRHKV